LEARRRAWLALGAAALLPRAAAALEGPPLVARLRQGDLVLLIRHASTEAGLGDPPGHRLGDCSTQRNLSDAGRAEARRLGDWLRSEHIPIAKAYTSPWCRCRETAQLAFGLAEDWAPLGSFFDAPDREAEAIATVRRRIGTYTFRKPGGNVAMVTHNVNIAGLTKLSVATGEVVVVRPDGCCGLRVLGRIVAP
jgi:phosphohistidine phosphatase SixA